MKILYCENRYPRPAADAIAAEPPCVSLLTDSSLSRNRLPLFLPPHSGDWRLTFGLGLRIVRLGKYIAPRFASRYYDAVTLVARLRPEGVEMPATACLTAFDSSAVVGEWLEPAPMLDVAGETECSVPFDAEVIDDTVARLSRYFTLRTGDIITAGDLPITAPVVIDTRISLTINQKDCLTFKIK